MEIFSRIFGNGSFDVSTPSGWKPVSDSSHSQESSSASPGSGQVREGNSIPLNTLRLQGFYGTTPHGESSINKCAVCQELIQKGEDYCRILWDGNTSALGTQRFRQTGLKSELSGANNCKVVANVFICEPCAKRSRNELVNLSEKILSEINHGPDHWTIHYPGE